MKNSRIGFIGGGNMARSLVGGLVADGVPPASMVVAEPDAGRRADLAARFGVEVTADNAAAARSADVLVFAVKPQVLPDAARGLAGAIADDPPLVVSVAAGVLTSDLRGWLGGRAPIVRAMPNTPALLRCGATALFAGEGVDEAQRELAEAILRAVGTVTWVDDEGLMDVVTALSGSGPAYFFLLMESMAGAATRLGLPAGQARLLTLETALGAARMAIESEQDVAELRRGVTSPGGTTQAALERLQAGDFPALVAAAIDSATRRSRQLASRNDKEPTG